MNKIKIEGHSNLVKDPETGAILSNKTTEYEQYIHLKNTKEQESKKIDYMYNEIMNLKNEIFIIKNRLEELRKWIQIKFH